ncbi:hypothetical protein ACFOGJ_17415 [Marinibaculum pumilum]|uniref:Transmembrane protein n=1 Tax=Marinibaculum pumilum TaxID=1766165 RepID=A0ABV7L309_9PROT
MRRAIRWRFWAAIHVAGLLIIGIFPPLTVLIDGEATGGVWIGLVFDLPPPPDCRQGSRCSIGLDQPVFWGAVAAWSVLVALAAMIYGRVRKA